jgi:hypothetical protein
MYDVPVAREIGFGDAGARDQVGAVEEGAGADVGRQRAQLAAEAGGRAQREVRQLRRDGRGVVGGGLRSSSRRPA